MFTVNPVITKQIALTTSRALAKNDISSVSFSEDAINIIRAEADIAALKLVYHDLELHQELSPKSNNARQIFSDCELVRVMSIGALRFSGVRANIKNWLCKDKLPTLALEIFNHLVEGSSITRELVSISDHINSQQDFAMLVLKLIKDEESQVTKAQTMVNDQVANSSNIYNQNEKIRKTINTIASNAKEGKSAAIAERQEILSDIEPYSYKVFSHKFDKVIVPLDLVTYEKLKQLRTQLEHQFQAFTKPSEACAILQQKLMAKYEFLWLEEQEQGFIDTKKLSQIIANPNFSNYYKEKKEHQLNDTIVTLLIDNSGSMRGKPITLAAFATETLARILERFHVKCEILGFTTVEWKGGESYKQWAEEGRRPRPGRLNDLRHIIYKSADVPWCRAKNNLGLMLKEGVLKENIDGEALLWANKRLMSRKENRRILIIISDGAPIDDSTLSVNHNSYLEAHLENVIARIEKSKAVELLAIGIGHDVSKYYKNAVTIKNAETLGHTLFIQLAAML